MEQQASTETRTVEEEEQAWQQFLEEQNEAYERSVLAQYASTGKWNIY